MKRFGFAQTRRGGRVATTWQGAGVQPSRSSEVLATLVAAGVTRGQQVGLAVTADGVVALAPAAGPPIVVPGVDGPAIVAAVDVELRPRWAVWSGDTAAALRTHRVRIATCWDLAAVHRLLGGGWRADPGRIWARLHGLPTADVPADAPVDLFNQADHEADATGGPIRDDGHLRPGWAAGRWADTPDRVARWAELARDAAVLQQRDMATVAADHPKVTATARAESTVELLCAELAADGLPVDRARAEAIIAGFVGPRTHTEAEAAAERHRRDADVLRHAPGAPFDLRSPAQVKSLLRWVGIEVPDTRAWRLEQLVDAHPVIGPLLAWRKAERILTTFGYAWLDEHLDDDGRLHGTWTGCDGAAGRMTASAGLHNMPADLRGAVVADPGHVFVRADLGQIEPRVLAAISGDRALAAATRQDDMYAEVALQLAVDRPTAKVAVLGAMYGQTTGLGAQALRGLERAYPVAMGYLTAADRAAQVGTDLRTYGGRRVRMAAAAGLGVSDRDARARAAAQGRYGRNAMVQGAAAELFKVWAVTVRARAAALDARVVLCLHDELLVHAPAAHGPAVAALVDDCLQEAAARWAPDRTVRFVADTSVIACWADAKP